MELDRHEGCRTTAFGSEADIGQKSAVAVPAASSLTKRQFADVDHARGCHDRNFEMICLHDVRNVAWAVRDNVDAGPASQAVVEQARAT
jgi:hypothetical protein